MRSSKYTAELLGPIVASSLSLAQVLRKLGLKPTGGNYRYLNALIGLAGRRAPVTHRSIAHGAS